MSVTIRLKIKGTIPGHPVGSVVEVETDEHGTPLDHQWRRRLRDSKHDGCVEVEREVESPAKSARRSAK